MHRSAEAFIQECRDRDYAKSTIEKHTLSLQLLSEWSEGTELSIKECSPDEIEEFIQWAKQQRTITYTDIRSETFHSLQKYFEYLVEEGEITQNPCAEVNIVECLILDEASRFLQRIRATKAEETVANREIGLIQFTEWLETEAHSELAECNPLTLEDYAIYLKQMGYSDTTVKDRFAAVSTLYEFLHSKVGLLEENPAEEVNLDDADIVDYRNPTRKSSELAEDIPYVTREQKEKMKEDCPGPKTRNELLIEFMWETGLRRDEVANVTLSNIDREAREIRVQGKNEKNRHVFYQPTLDTLLNIWL